MSPVPEQAPIVRVEASAEIARRLREASSACDSVPFLGEQWRVVCVDVDVDFQHTFTLRMVKGDSTDHRPPMPTPDEVFTALAPIIKALPTTPQGLDDDSVLTWSKDALRVGDIRRIRKVWKQALDATEPDATEIDPADPEESQSDG